MNTKYLTSIFAVAAATFAALLPTGGAWATGTVGSSEFDAYCARQPAGPTVPQQSRPYRASGSSCALCHPGGNTSQFNTLGTATRTCSTTSCPSTVNPFCTNAAPTGTLTISTSPAGTTVAAGTAVTFTAIGASDPDGFTLTYSWTFSGVSGPPPTATGTSTSVTVTPTSAGTLTATLQVTDPDGAVHATRPTRSVTVTAPQPPVVNADSYSVQTGQTLTVAAPGVLGNDTNPAGTGTLTAQLVSGPASGTLSLNATGGFTYTPPAGFTGSTTFTYRATNGTTTSGNATVTLSVSASPPPPVANADSYTVQSGQVLTVAAPGVLGNDTNPAGTGTLSAQRVTGPTSGTLNLSANGGFTYTPAVGFTGDVTFTYIASNGTATSANATVTIAVTAPPPPPPTACTDADRDGFYAEGGLCGPKDCNDNNAAVNPGATEICGDGIDNDCDGATDSADKECNGTDCLARFFAKPVVITQASWGPDDGVNQLDVEGSQADPGAAVTMFNAATGARLGTTTAELTGSDVGQWQFEINTNTPPCRVRVEINGQMAERPVSNAPSNCVGAPPPGPVANADSYAVVGGTTLTVAAPGVLSNDRVAAGRTLTAVAASNPTSGTLNLAANGGFIYTPAAGFSGTATFSYRASDGTATSAPATVTITVSAPANRPPNGTITPPGNIVAGQAVTFTGTGTDPDGNLPLRYNWNFGTSGVPASTLQNPRVTFGSAGTFTVTLTVTDSLGLDDPTPHRVTVTVAPANRPPEGTILSPTGNVTIERGRSVSFRSTGSDPEGNTPLTYTWDFGGGATNSTLQNPSVRFSRNGTYTVSLTVRDSRGLADPTPATVTVRVVEDD